MKYTTEQSGTRSRRSIETSPAIDRAVAALIIVVVLAVAHLLGLDTGLLQLVSGIR